MPTHAKPSAAIGVGLGSGMQAGRQQATQRKPATSVKPIQSVNSSRSIQSGGSRRDRSRQQKQQHTVARAKESSHIRSRTTVNARNAGQPSPAHAASRCSAIRCRQRSKATHGHVNQTINLGRAKQIKHVKQRKHDQYHHTANELQ